MKTASTADIKKVLITGGSGLVGRYLTSLLLSHGHKVIHLSRSRDKFGTVRVHRWDPEKKILDPSILDGVDCLIHLAGANIGEKRWSGKRREEIIKSRADSALFLHSVIQEKGIPLGAFISASATGYYGSETSDRIFTEADSPGNGFLAEVCSRWEEAAADFKKSGIRTVRIRSGMVLEENDSALSRLLLPAKYGFLVRLGTGCQYVPWIHIQDLCSIYVNAVENRLPEGVYNAVAPQHVTHDEFIRTLGIVTGKPVSPIKVPAFMLSAALGKMSEVVLKGSRISSDKLLQCGFKFAFPGLKEALSDLLKQN